jgi:heme transport system ATP-binding protein
VLDLKHLSYHIKDKVILRDINFSLNSGEHLVILGANGAGKSTLLKLITADIHGYLGAIKLNGKPLADYKAHALARIRAVMPQEVQLEFSFTAKEVVAMGHAPHPPAEQHNSITESCLEKMDITHLADRTYPNMSGGEKQRVQLARILCQIDKRASSIDKRYLFLDECTSALDPAHQHQVFEQVTRLKVEQNLGVLSIMHDLNLAAHYADRILLLKDGCIIALGAPEEALTSKNLKAAYAIETQVLQHPTTQKPLIVNLGV